MDDRQHTAKDAPSVAALLANSGTRLRGNVLTGLVLVVRVDLIVVALGPSLSSAEERLQKLEDLGVRLENLVDLFAVLLVRIPTKLAKSLLDGVGVFCGPSDRLRLPR